MNISKLFDELLESEELQDIPILHILVVVNTVFDLINSGRFFYENEAGGL